MVWHNMACYMIMPSMNFIITVLACHDDHGMSLYHFLVCQACQLAMAVLHPRSRACPRCPCTSASRDGASAWGWGPPHHLATGISLCWTFFFLFFFLSCEFTIGMVNEVLFISCLLSVNFLKISWNSLTLIETWSDMSYSYFLGLDTV